MTGTDIIQWVAILVLFGASIHNSKTLRSLAEIINDMLKREGNR
jgi:hypothetical protein